MDESMQHDEYRKLAELEDAMWYFRALHAHVERCLAPKLLPRARDPILVLDAGCGTGGLIRRLAPRHPSWRWTGIDLSPIACELARDRVGVPILDASVTEIPFSEETFDAVVSADVLYHVDDDERALREFFRVLKPGGTVVLNVPAYQWLWSYHDVAVEGRRRYSRSALLAKLRRAGFENPTATYWNTLLFPAIVVRRKCLPAPASGSDVAAFSPWAEAIFRRLMRAERSWIENVSALPFGCSVLACACKPVHD
jgi:SAM-dependent methyltransferase